MIEIKDGVKYIEQDPPMIGDPDLTRKMVDYLAYLKEQINFILSTNGKNMARRVTFTALAEPGETVINGRNISTGKIQDPEGKNSWDLVNGPFNITDGTINISFTKTFYASDYTQADLTLATNIIIGAEPLTDEYLDKYDINLDGVINILDIVAIRNFVIGQSGDITCSITLSIDPSNSREVLKIFAGGVNTTLKPGSVSTGSVILDDDASVTKYSIRLNGITYMNGEINLSSTTNDGTVTSKWNGRGDYEARDENGTTRIKLDYTGLYFYDANGTLTNSYTA